MPSYLTTTSCFSMMLSVSNYEYSQGDLLGHGAFALVFKGRRKKVSKYVLIWPFGGCITC